MLLFIINTTIRDQPNYIHPLKHFCPGSPRYQYHKNVLTCCSPLTGEMLRRFSDDEFRLFKHGRTVGLWWQTITGRSPRGGPKSKMAAAAALPPYSWVWRCCFGSESGFLYFLPSVALKPWRENRRGRWPRQPHAESSFLKKLELRRRSPGEGGVKKVKTFILVAYMESFRTMVNKIRSHHQISTNRLSLLVRAILYSSSLYLRCNDYYRKAQLVVNAPPPLVNAPMRSVTDGFNVFRCVYKGGGGGCGAKNARRATGKSTDGEGGGG